jgi:hypothetical protein
VGEQVSLGGHHGHRCAKLVGRVLHEGALAVALLARPVEQRVKGTGQGAEFVMAWCQPQGDRSWASRTDTV